MAVDSYIFNAQAGETPETVARRRQVADVLAARIFGRAPQNVGEGIASIGQALIARSMANDAEAAQKAGQASANSAFSSLFPAAGAPASPAATPAPADAMAPAATPIPAPTPAPPASAVPFATATGGSPRSYFDAVKTAESGGNPAAANPNSSAAGLYQFTTPTWNDLMRSHPELALTVDGRSDPQQQERAMRAFTDQNAGALTAAGIDATPANLYAAHFLGPGGARTVLSQPDTVPMTLAAGPEVVRANPFLASMTVGDFKDWTGRKVGGSMYSPQQPFPAPIPGQQPQVVGANQSSPLDAAQYPAGPVGAPASRPATVAAQPAAQTLSIQQLAQIASNPWLNKGQQGIVGALLKQQMQNADPMRALQIQKLQADIDKATGKTGTEYGLTPVYGTDEKGNTVLGVIGKNGTFKPVDTGGVKIQSGVEKIDLGTHYQLRDKRTGQVIGVEPKDIAGAAKAKEEGIAAGKATIAAPMDIQAGNNALDTITKIRKHPYLDRGTGLTSFGNVIPGSGGYDFQNLVDQSKSGAFLQAIQQMRGLGSLSNAEGTAATAAVNRMNTATSKEAFLDAVSDYEKIVKQGISRAQKRLPSPENTPSSGEWQDIGGVKIRRKQ